ncbi:MAG: SRPBCC domain-containing protein [Acidocella sp.]|nr:SRPBCC domain-containing protein [Acidocella sp.]
MKVEISPAPLKLSRVYAAPPAQVFAAWSSAAHIKNWFCPEGLTIPTAEVDFTPGGVFSFTMQAPDGTEYPAHGNFIEITAPERLVFTLDIPRDGKILFTAHTIVTFEHLQHGTRMNVEQSYKIFDAAAYMHINGAPIGWASTLDKLQAHLAATRPRNVSHGSFTIKRHYNASPATIFHAFTDRAAKAKWFESNPACTILQRSMDVRPGGREHLTGRWPDDSEHMFDALYYDVIENQRLIYCYEMHLGGQKISISLATIELHPSANGTNLSVTEHGAFLDGFDDASTREHGTGWLLDQLEVSLQN